MTQCQDYFSEYWIENIYSRAIQYFFVIVNAKEQEKTHTARIFTSENRTLGHPCEVFTPAVISIWGDTQNLLLSWSKEQNTSTSAFQYLTDCDVRALLHSLLNVIWREKRQSENDGTTKLSSTFFIWYILSHWKRESIVSLSWTLSLRFSCLLGPSKQSRQTNTHIQLTVLSETCKVAWRFGSCAVKCENAGKKHLRRTEKCAGHWLKCTNKNS